jgi:MFS family permease
MVMMTVAMGAPYLVIVALKPIAAEFDWPRAVPSLCYAFALLGAGLGGLLMGRLADRVGMGTPALVGSLSIGIGAWLASRAEGAFMLYLAHGLFLGFFGNGAFVAPLLANVTKWFDRRRGVAVALVSSGQSLAGALWPPVLRYLTDSFGWRQAFFIYALAALVMLAPLSLLLRPLPPIEDTAERVESWDRRALGWPAEMVLAMLCLAIIGCCVAMAMPMVHIVAHATDLGHPGARAAEMLSLLLACAFVSRILFGALADRIGGLWMLLVGSAGQAAVLASYAFVESFLGLYAISALFGLVFGGIVPAYAIIVRELFPASQAGWRIGPFFCSAPSAWRSAARSAGSFSTSPAAIGRRSWSASPSISAISP